MSRLDGRMAAVTLEQGQPAAVAVANGRSRPVLSVVSHWREWLGALAGEPERDVWQVETSRGTLELHCQDGDWQVFRWDD